MPIFSYSKVADSTKSAHYRVSINDKVAGEVWREQAHVPDSKGKQSLKWRWFARREGETIVLGKLTRAAVILGAGFSSKDKAADKLYEGREAVFA